MKRLSFFLLLVLTALFVENCSTSPDFERTNRNDPKSKYFIPDTPSKSSATISVDSTRNVKITWEMKELQEGVILSKKYSSSMPFIPLDTLESSNMVYIDTTKSFTQGTKYKLEYFRVLEDSTYVFNLDGPEIATLLFEPLLNLIPYYNNSLDIHAMYPNQSMDKYVRYYDGIEIEVNRSSNDTTQWEPVTVLSAGDPKTDYYYDTEVTFELFDLHIRMTQFILDSLGVRVPLYHETRHLNIYSLRNVNFRFETELSGTLSWENAASFSDGYIIKSDHIDTVFNALLSSYPIELNEVPDLPFSVSVKPFIDDNYGDFTSSHGSYPSVVTPEIDNLNTIDQNTLEFGWSTRLNNQAAGFIIQQSLWNENNFSTIDTIPGNENLYQVTGLDPTNKYSFRVRSYTTPWSDPVALEYQSSILPISTTELEVPGNQYTFSRSGKYVAKLVPGSSVGSYDYILITDLETNTEFSLELPRAIDDYDAEFRDFVVSEKNNTLIFYWDRDRIDIAWDYISVYDFINETYIIENVDTPGNGGYDIELLNNDYMIAIKLGSKIQVFDTENNVFVSELEAPFTGNWILRSSSDMAVHCSPYGVSLFDLTNNNLINQTNIPCDAAFIDEDSDILNIISTNAIYKFDLVNYTYSSLNNAPNNLNNITQFWNFEETGILIYNRGWSNNYIGYSLAENSEFLLNVFDTIQLIDQLPDGTFSATTFSKQYILDFGESWARIY